MATIKPMQNPLTSMDAGPGLQAGSRVARRLAGASVDSKRHAAVEIALVNTEIASMSDVLDHQPVWVHHPGQFGGVCVQYNVNALLRDWTPRSRLQG